MSVLDSARAIQRGYAAMGKPDGAGMCLANNYAWWGSVPSIGPGAGQYDVALKGWTFATKRHPGDWNPPAGVPVWFGVSPTRRDKNAAAGDVGLSLGGGNAIFTDSPNGTPGIMSLAARGRQIARPYLGWTEDFLGHDTQAGIQWVQERTPAVVVTIKPPTPQREYGDDMAQMVTVGPGVLGGDIAVLDGNRSAYHTQGTKDAYQQGRSLGILKPGQNSDAAIRARLTDLGLNIGTDELQARLRAIRQVGGYVDPHYAGKF